MNKKNIIHKHVYISMKYYLLSFLVPVVTLGITEFVGDNLGAATGNSIKSLFSISQKSHIWPIILVLNIILYTMLYPINKYLIGQFKNGIVISSYSEKMLKNMKATPLVALIFPVVGLTLSGVLKSWHSVSDDGNSFFLIYSVLNEFSTGYFVGVILYTITNNYLHLNYNIFSKSPDIEQLINYSLFKNFSLSVSALIFFLLFQNFNEIIGFYSVDSISGFEILSNIEWKGISNIHITLRNRIIVLLFKFAMINIIILGLLSETKKMFINSLESINSTLDDIISEKNTLEFHYNGIISSEFEGIFNKLIYIVKKQNSKIKYSENRLNDIINYAKDPIVSYCVDGSIVMINPAAEIFFGYKKHEALNKRINDLVVNLSLDTNGSINSIQRLEGLHKSGQTLIFESSISQASSIHESHLTLIIRDLSNQIMIEKKIEEARLAAENANLMKSQFLANMSHELRTPLNAVLGYSQLLLMEDTISIKQKEKIGIISKSSNHLLNIINDILDFSKIENGSVVYEESPVDLKTVMNDLEMMFIEKCHNQGIQIVFKYYDDVPNIILTDKKKLIQILINLIGNSVKFTLKGQVIVEYIKCANKVKFSIRDTGIGMTGIELKKIGEPFYQSVNPVNNEGTGLGLAISKKLIHILGGELFISSKQREGSEFYFFIPLNENDNQNSNGDNSNKSYKLKSTYKETILVVDDNEDNRELLKIMLEKAGFRTILAINGLDAINYSKQSNIRIILMDIKMPVMDGYAAVKAIRSFEDGVNRIIIALTASAFLHDEKNILNSGFDGYLSKPFIFEDLLSIIADKAKLKFNVKKHDIIHNKQVQDLDYKEISKSITIPELKKIKEYLKINNFQGLIEVARRLSERTELEYFSKKLIEYSEQYNEKELKEIIMLIKKEEIGYGK